MEIPVKAKGLVVLSIQALRQIELLPLMSSDSSSDLPGQKLLISLNSVRIEVIVSCISWNNSDNSAAVETVTWTDLFAFNLCDVPQTHCYGKWYYCSGVFKNATPSNLVISSIFTSYRKFTVWGTSQVMRIFFSVTIESLKPILFITS